MLADHVCIVMFYRYIEAMSYWQTSPWAVSSKLTVSFLNIIPAAVTLDYLALTYSLMWLTLILLGLTLTSLPLSVAS